MTERVSDRDLAAAAAVPAGTVTARTDTWVVGVDAVGEPTTVVPPGGAPGALVSSFVIVDAATPVGIAARSAAFAELDADGVAVVMGRGNVVGVWRGLDLANAFIGGGSRSAGDTALHGEIDIPKIHKTCRYDESGRRCTASMTFPTKPAPMPDCPNPVPLAAHRFGW